MECQEVSAPCMCTYCLLNLIIEELQSASKNHLIWLKANHLFALISMANVEECYMACPCRKCMLSAGEDLVVDASTHTQGKH